MSGQRWLQWRWFVLAVVAVATVSVTAAFRNSSDSSSTSTAAPAFTASDLAETPAQNWYTNGGSSTNDRYSSLSQINSTNVSGLKGVFRTHLLKSGLAAKYSGEGQPLVYDGIIYATTGADDVFAVSGTTGDILWHYAAHLNQKISTVCCGWDNRGVAIGDGLVYFGELDGSVVALDQNTGKLVWKKQLVRWQTGQTITGAPLYLDGKIYIGVVGADFGTRGLLQAMDAKTGAKLWRFYTVPGPNDPGGNTWPKGSSAYLRGGGSVWSTPAVDSSLGLMYITTGNAGNDWFGGLRAGSNLYTSSIVALNIATGKVAWHFQEVHHDIWDYDTPSPAMLFDATIDGKSVPGIGAAGKTGWLYLLNRATGKPLYGIVERPVPQNAAQHTWPTQPIPLTGAFIPHGAPTAAAVKRVKSERTGPSAKVPVQVAQTMYTPPSTTKMLIYTPGPEGGNNWEPASFNSNTHMFYVCAAVSTVGVLSANVPFKVGQSYSGVAGIAGIGFNEGTGTLTAIDGNSGKVVWQNKWKHPCYSGTVTTAGNLVFAGQNSGQFQAFDATTGKLLWSFQTGAGADDTPAVYDVGGHEYVALLSAGNSLVASPHGDSLWVFGLNGTLAPAAAPGKGEGTVHKEGGATTTVVANAAAGKTVFQQNCSTCHGNLGQGGNGGPDLQNLAFSKTAANVVKQVTNGGGGMPAFGSQLSKQQIANVAAYVSQKIAK
jgi:quinohemoprotein ethanol dehydrogenase